MSKCRGLVRIPTTPYVASFGIPFMERRCRNSKPCELHAKSQIYDWKPTETVDTFLDPELDTSSISSERTAPRVAQRSVVRFKDRPGRVSRAT